MRRKGKPKRKICPVFSQGQGKIIDEIKDTGKYGDTDTEVVKNIVVEFLHHFCKEK